jgi:hypothetical protein
MGGAILTCFCAVHRDEVIVQYCIRDSILFLSYVMVGRLFGTGILIFLYLCPIAAHLAPEVQYILDTTHF